MNLTDEQRSICETCKPPFSVALPKFKFCTSSSSASNSQLVRVTAAAGAGKTTVLLALAQKAANLGHRDITYLTFSKAAAKDGEQRLTSALQRDSATRITAATIHSTAYRCLKTYYERLLNNNDETDDHEVARRFLSSKVPKSDKEIQEWISKELDEEIEDFLKQCYSSIKKTTKVSKHEDLKIKIRRRKQRARRKVEEFILKTLVKQFCNLKVSVREFSDKEYKQRIYFVAQKFHVRDKNKKNSKECQGIKYGFDHSKYTSTDTAGNWYADKAIHMWKLSLQQGIRSFAFEVKRAQLLKLQLPNPSTLLLVDESQDMDECQVDWMVTQQSKHDLQLYVVGDAAQSIYAFRGARSRYLMDLPATTDKQLTASWRFGPQIAAIANVILFAKEKSIQSRPKFQYKQGESGEWKYKYWIPYRVTVGDPTKSCKVLSKSILPEWKTQGKITILGMTNACLFSKIVDTFLADMSPEDLTNGDNSVSNEGSDVEEEEEEEEEEQQQQQQHPAMERKKVGSSKNSRYPKELPKFHVNSGSNAGRYTFKKAFRQIGILYDLFKDKHLPQTLPKNDFPEFEGARVTWKSFLEECEEFEYRQYGTATGIIHKFKEGTLDAVEKFETYVLGYQFTASQADIILSTAHSAKGMEWDQVELVDGFPTLASFNKKGAKYDKIGPSKFKRREGDFWQFAVSEFSDYLNLLYVAATRAKRTLVINNAIADLLNDFDALYQWILKNELRDDEVPESKTPPKLRGACDLDLRNIPDFFRDLVQPFRVEHGLDEGTLSSDALIQNSCSAEATYDSNDLKATTTLAAVGAVGAASAEGAAGAVVTPDTTQDSEEERDSGTSDKRKRLFDAISNIPNKRRRGAKISANNQSAKYEKSIPQKTIDSFLRPEKKPKNDAEKSAAEVESCLETSKAARTHQSTDSVFSDRNSKAAADSSPRRRLRFYDNAIAPMKRNESSSSQDSVKYSSAEDKNPKVSQQKTMDAFFGPTRSISPNGVASMSHDVSAVGQMTSGRKAEGRKRKHENNKDNVPPTPLKSAAQEASCMGQRSIETFFSPNSSKWACAVCTLENPAACRYCQACGNRHEL